MEPAEDAVRAGLLELEREAAAVVQVRRGEATWPVGEGHVVKRRGAEVPVERRALRDGDVGPEEGVVERRDGRSALDVHRLARRAIDRLRVAVGVETGERDHEPRRV